MFSNIICQPDYRVIAASFSGALVFFLIEKKYKRSKKWVLFGISFVMGILGADAAVSILSHYFSEDIGCGREVGGFVCSVTIVSLGKGLLSLPDILFRKFKRN
ncbi:putative holin [Pantoea allii]|uniref:Phage holin family protein n=1 Tax=Pantoea allii TaxID=574096 RepID=A0ABS6VI94_9GAMM|nr:putative holin [Pantoea allii]MBW1215644.1 phage holin family protein [Pantoea allii]MBW1254922.1 phage holin family protein [Pantoea allii]MBW1259059.1 phage holin family protein [Pantoea allii]MBW1264259.1 phage holin family protein [Pantoea allii]MBW1268248.1 phage holin family protein [Pantoea allii]